MAMLLETGNVRSLVKLLLIAAALIGLGVWLWKQTFGTYHFMAVEDGALYRDGVRDVSELAHACRRADVKTIVMLVDDAEMFQEPFAQEMKFIFHTHLKCVRVPIALGGWPTTEQVRQFLAVATDEKSRPVLVHCARGCGARA